MKRQIVIVHGGNPYNSYEDFLDYLKNREVSKEKFMYNPGWKDTIESELQGEFEILRPEMPNKQNAHYNEWKIWFERMLPYVEDDVIFVGHSLGGIFLAKYLSENEFSKKIKQLHLVAAPFESGGVGDFEIEKPLAQVSKRVKNIFLYYSEDDELVPLAEGKMYKNKFLDANLQIFENRGHFRDSQFPELIKNIRS